MKFWGVTVLAADQKQKFIQFLAGLNSDYAPSKTNILSMDPLPTVNRAYYILLQVEKQNKLNDKQQIVTSQISAFNSMKHNSLSYNSGGRRDFKKHRVDKNDRKCDYCKKTDHTMDQCFKLSGNVPEWFTNLKNKQSNGGSTPKMAAHVSDIHTDEYIGDNPLEYHSEHSVPQEVAINPSLVNVVYKEMMKLMKTQSNTARECSQLSPPINFAGTSHTSPTPLSTCYTHLDWIVDTGATDHMICNKSMFLEYKVLTQPITVGLPDGKLKLVDHIGSVSLTPNIHISNVFYLLDFKHNLLSVGCRLLDEHKLLAKFTPTSCVF